MGSFIETHIYREISRLREKTFAAPKNITKNACVSFSFGLSYTFREYRQRRPVKIQSTKLKLIHDHNEIDPEVELSRELAEADNGKSSSNFLI